MDDRTADRAWNGCEIFESAQSFSDGVANQIIERFGSPNDDDKGAALALRFMDSAKYRMDDKAGHQRHWDNIRPAP